MPKHNIDSLIKASRKGDLKQIGELLNWGIDINASNKKDKNPLTEALISKNLKTVNFLLTAGADPHNGLVWASRDNNREMVECLLNAGANANLNTHDSTPLVTAILFYNLEVIELLLDRGADINATVSGRVDENALSAAIINPARIDIVRLLLKRGADVNAEGGYGSMLQTAIFRHDVEIVKILLNDARIDVNADGREGNALDVAYDAENSEIIQLLLECGAKTTSIEETSEGFSNENISEEESSDETISDKESLRENTKDEESLNQETTKAVTLKAEEWDEDTSREDTMKQAVKKERSSVSKENVQEKITKEDIDNASDKTPLIWACEHHNLDKVRRLLGDHIDNTSQTTLGETALILAIPKIPQKLDKEIKEVLRLLRQAINIVNEMS